jgi:hypothetical protein
VQNIPSLNEEVLYEISGYIEPRDGKEMSGKEPPELTAYLKNIEETTGAKSKVCHVIAPFSPLLFFLCFFCFSSSFFLYFLFLFIFFFLFFFFKYSFRLFYLLFSICFCLN